MIKAFENSNARFCMAVTLVLVFPGSWCRAARAETIAARPALTAGAAHPSEAVAFFEQALQLNRENETITPDVLQQKAYFYCKALELEPDFAEAWNNLGDVYESLGDFEAALQCYEKTVALRPDLAIAYFGMGDVHARCGRNEDAVRCYEEGLKHHPSPEEAACTQRRMEALRAEAAAEGAVLGAKDIAARLEAPVARGIGGVVNAPVVPFNEARVGFGYNSAVLVPGAKAQLTELGKALEMLVASPGNADACFEISGHTDARGSDEYNYELGLQRAESVRTFLVAGWPRLAERLVTCSHGEHMLIKRHASTELEHAVNRRVEVRKVERVDAQAPERARRELTLEVAVFRRTPSGGREQVVSGEGVLVSRDLYQVYVRPRTDCYVYVYQYDSAGKGAWLFPRKETSGQATRLAADAEYWLPAEGQYYTLDETPGEEVICIVASRSRAADLEYLLQHPSPEGREEQVQIAARGVARIAPVQEAREQGRSRPDTETLFATAGAFRARLAFRHAPKAER